HDGGVADAVEAGVSGGQQSVDVVAGDERVAGFVLAGLPVHACAFGVGSVEAFDASAFTAAQLLHGEVGDVVIFGESHGVHAAGGTRTVRSRLTRTTALSSRST